ncbi:hypothetical protein MNBD_GAMMA01-444 [hydrothermal vent metagenome]|uniref:Uncharacterized protein n=1 Tax=hydrothermal vent metagenome TaxID=652676 RepID=A0A3B0V6X8_9ZZZZ
MNKKPIEYQAQVELEHYFADARAQQCPPSMKQKLYAQLSINSKVFWQAPKLVGAGLALVFVSSILFKTTYDNKLKSYDLYQAQLDLQVAMHYMNQVSLKSLTAVNNKGLKPALIRPLSKSVASL